MGSLKTQFVPFACGGYIFSFIKRDIGMSQERFSDNVRNISVYGV